MLLLLFSNLNVLLLRLVLLVSEKNYGFLLQVVHLLSEKVAFLLIFYCRWYTFFQKKLRFFLYFIALLPF